MKNREYGRQNNPNCTHIAGITGAESKESFPALLCARSAAEGRCGTRARPRGGVGGECGRHLYHVAGHDEEVLLLLVQN